ncbi:hypothetical protein LCGC14_1088880 [marine sediment metagenome]|uniref:Uncharacterized protein n=1 Tax=marine sediment metagenome TaxID=412755 RepID=A0A0F9MHG1_9ZZZZ
MARKARASPPRRGILPPGSGVEMENASRSGWQNVVNAETPWRLVWRLPGNCPYLKESAGSRSVLGLRSRLAAAPSFEVAVFEQLGTDSKDFADHGFVFTPRLGRMLEPGIQRLSFKVETRGKTWVADLVLCPPIQLYTRARLGLKAWDR